MKWATRAGVHLDRASCAWLIGGYVDAQAELVFDAVHTCLCRSQPDGTPWTPGWRTP